MQTSDKKKVALFLPSLNGGGAQRVMINIAQGLTEKGIEVDFVLAKAEGPYLADMPKAIKIFDLKSSRTLTSLPGLVRYLRLEKPESILSAMEHANIVTIWAAWLARVKTRVVVSVHISYRFLDFSSIRGRFWKLLIRKFYPWAKTVVVVSEEAKNDFLSFTGLDPEKVITIYNPVIMPDLFKKAKMPLYHPWFALNEPPVILGVGRLSKQKNFSNLIRAFAQVRQKCPVRLIIIGEGEDRSEIENLATELDVKEYIDLPGFVDNPYAYMAQASVFVLSSSYEGLPTVLIEALAAGVPVISTDCPTGPREILKGGKYGRLVSVNDSHALAESILDVILNNEAPVVDSDALSPYYLETSVIKYMQVL